MIVGYGGGRTQVLGETTIQLEVDLAKAEVQAYVVVDRHQETHVMIGQSFLNKANVALVVKTAKSDYSIRRWYNYPKWMSCHRKRSLYK